MKISDIGEFGFIDAIKADIPVWKQEFYADSEESLWLSNNG